MQLEQPRYRSAAPGRLRRRRGTILVLSAVLMIVMLGMVAFALDIGYIASTDTELARTSDAAALAGAAGLIDGTDAAEAAIHEYVALNPVAGHTIPTADVDIQFGEWNPDNRTFSSAGGTPSAVKVTLLNQEEPLFFGRVFDRNQFDLQQSSIARYQPREIFLVLDFSGSMCYDSQLMQIGTLGQTYIENLLQTIYGELGSPVYGNMTFAPKEAKFTGMTPTNGNMAQIQTTFADSHDVDITSTKPIQTVKLKFSNGNTQTFTLGSGSTTYSGTWKGSGGNANRQVDAVWVQSGTNNSNVSGGTGEYFTDSATNLKSLLNLTNVPYPYPGGSWSDYIDYVKTNSDVASAGHRKSYGYLTWVNYLQDAQWEHEQTPDLWKTSEQPVSALKNAVSIFLAYLQEKYTGDRVGLSIYNAEDGNGIVEHDLTIDFAAISDTVQHRQAAHYHPNTNIYAGFREGRLALQNNARTGAFKMLVLMTDGVANMPGSGSTPKNMVLQEANLCAAAKIPVVTISLGALADTALMQQVATITGGHYFQIPGGQTAEQYEEDLRSVFKEIADSKPLQLVGSPEVVSY